MTWNLMFQVLIYVVIITTTTNLVTFTVAYKQGVKDGYLKGRAAGMRIATDRVKAFK